MSGFTVYYFDGGYTEFPQGGKQADVVVEWFRTADDDALLSLHTETGTTIHATKCSISRIAVTK